jgi:hypothetical protein
MQKIFSLVIPSFVSLKSARGEKRETLLPVVPSWNDILALQSWARMRRKEEIQVAFLSALRAAAAAQSTTITCAKNSLSIAADMLDSYRMTATDKRKSKQLAKRLEKKNRKALLSKSSLSEP